jgi:hypothetical protein
VPTPAPIRARTGPNAGATTCISIDALDTAWAQKLLGTQPAVMSMAERLAAWSRISLMLNELNRSVGRGDAYPFVINEYVAEKLEFIEQVIAHAPVRALTR